MLPPLSDQTVTVTVTVTVIMHCFFFPLRQPERRGNMPMDTWSFGRALHEKAPYSWRSFISAWHGCRIRWRSVPPQQWWTDVCATSLTNCLERAGTRSPASPPARLVSKVGGIHSGINSTAVTTEVLGLSSGLE
jgi:hypothetical protein